jgi:hypothetical protein
MMDDVAVTSIGKGRWVAKDATIPFTFGAGVGAKAFLVLFIVPNKPGEKKAFEFDVI